MPLKVEENVIYFFIIFLSFQIELENLNTATDEINKLEIELEVQLVTTFETNTETKN